MLGKEQKNRLFGSGAEKRRRFKTVLDLPTVEDGLNRIAADPRFLNARAGAIGAILWSAGLTSDYDPKDLIQEGFLLVWRKALRNKPPGLPPLRSSLPVGAEGRENMLRAYLTTTIYRRTLELLRERRYDAKALTRALKRVGQELVWPVNFAEDSLGPSLGEFTDLPREDRKRVKGYDPHIHEREIQQALDFTVDAGLEKVERLASLKSRNDFGDLAYEAGLSLIPGREELFEREDLGFLNVVAFLRDLSEYSLEKFRGKQIEEKRSEYARYRLAFIHEMKDIPTKTTAKTLGVSPNAVYILRSRAKKWIQANAANFDLRLSLEI